MLSGKETAYKAWAQLATRLLQISVMREGEVLSLERGETSGRVLSANYGKRALRLTNGKYLRFVQALDITDHKDGNGPRLRTFGSVYQYQRDDEPRMSKDWIFRYDYHRDPPPSDPKLTPKPDAHLQFFVTPKSPGWLPDGKCTSDIHFPTDRVSLEAVIRLLVDSFHVEPVYPDLWRDALAESERCFDEFKHRPRAPKKR
jgi:hypothetical protein